MNKDFCCFWHQKKSKGITKVIKMYPLGTMNVFIKSNDRLPNCSHWYTKLLFTVDKNIYWFILLTTIWTLLKSPVKVGVSVSVLYGGSRTLSDKSGIPGDSLELGTELNKCLSPSSSQIWFSSSLSRALGSKDQKSKYEVIYSSV